MWRGRGLWEHGGKECVGVCRGKEGIGVHVREHTGLWHTGPNAHVSEPCTHRRGKEVNDVLSERLVFFPRPFSNLRETTAPPSSELGLGRAPPTARCLQGPPPVGAPHLQVPPSCRLGGAEAAPTFRTVLPRSRVCRNTARCSPSQRSLWRSLKETEQRPVRTASMGL